MGSGLNVAAYVCMLWCVWVHVCGQHRASWLRCLAFQSNKARAAAMCWTGWPSLGKDGRDVLGGPWLQGSLHRSPLSIG